MQGREREIDTLSVRRPQPDTTNLYRGKEEKGKIVEDKKGESNIGQQKGIGPALETRQSHTIKYGINQFIVELFYSVLFCT